MATEGEAGGAGQLQRFGGAAQLQRQPNAPWTPAQTSVEPQGQGWGIAGPSQPLTARQPARPASGRRCRCQQAPPLRPAPLAPQACPRAQRSPPRARRAGGCIGRPEACSHPHAAAHQAVAALPRSLQVQPGASRQGQPGLQVRRWMVCRVAAGARAERRGHALVGATAACPAPAGNQSLPHPLFECKLDSHCRRRTWRPSPCQTACPPSTVRRAPCLRAPAPAACRTSHTVRTPLQRNACHQLCVPSNPLLLLLQLATPNCTPRRRPGGADPGGVPRRGQVPRQGAPCHFVLTACCRRWLRFARPPRARGAPPAAAAAAASPSPPRPPICLPALPSNAPPLARWRW